MGNSVAFQPYQLSIRHHPDSSSASPVGVSTSEVVSIMANDYDAVDDENHSARIIDNYSNNSQCQCQCTSSTTPSSVVALSSSTESAPINCENCHNQPVSDSRLRIDNSTSPKYRCKSSNSVVTNRMATDNNNNWIQAPIIGQSDQHSHQQSDLFASTSPTPTATLQNNSMAPLLANLAQMLNAQIGNYLEMSNPQSEIVATAASSTYKCAGNNRNSDSDNNSNKINYKNLFPKSSDDMEHLFAAMLASSNESGANFFGPQPQNQQQQQRRCSQLVAPPPANSLVGSCLMASSTAAVPGSVDTIKINLPEILDHQDEITILRLLIKLLAGKVTKLSDERRRLLQHITTLNEINAEMSAIIEYELKRSNSPADY